MTLERDQKLNICLAHYLCGHTSNFNLQHSFYHFIIKISNSFVNVHLKISKLGILKMYKFCMNPPENFEIMLTHY